MDNKTLIILILWSMQAVKQTLIWAYWLQVKEYRLDRFKVLLEGKEGLANLEIKAIIFKFALLFVAIFSGIDWPAILLFIWLNIKFFKELATKTLRKPILTLRMTEILGTSALGLLFTLWLGTKSGILASRLVLGELLLIILPFIALTWTTPLVRRSKKTIIKLAQSRLTRVKPIVIGITGSYGKSTTKKFTNLVLSSKYKTEKTEKNLNTDWGIARKAADLSPETEVFVVEMGAYKKGEIKSIADVVKPQIGIITGIEPQHLSLFGSLENIKKAKYELIESLPENGVAIFNVANPGGQELAQLAKDQGIKTRTYALNSEIEADLKARIKKVTTESVTFRLRSQGKEMEVTAPIKGKHFVENLLGAILAAKELKVDWEKIREAIKDIDPGLTLSVYKTKGGATIIDDSYNSTPIAFSSALDYLSLFEGKTKVLITSGIIELGEKSFEIHKVAASQAANVADEIILTNTDFEKSFTDGLGDKAKNLKIIKGEELAEKIKYYLWQDCVVLIEGRMPAKVMQELEKQRI